MMARSSALRRRSGFHPGRSSAGSSSAINVADSPTAIDRPRAAKPIIRGLSWLLNLACVCQLHHDLKHLAGWKCRQLDGGVLEWVAPTGHRYLDIPEPISPLIPTPRKRSAGSDHPGFRPGTGQGSRVHDLRQISEQEPPHPDPEDPFQPANLVPLTQLPQLSREEAHPPPF